MGRRGFLALKRGMRKGGGGEGISKAESRLSPGPGARCFGLICMRMGGAMRGLCMRG